MKAKRLAIVVVITGAVVYLVSQSESDEPKQQAESKQSSRCVKVPDKYLAGMSDGLTTDVSLSNGWAVRSDDFKKVWYVSARVRSGDIDDIATWATTGSPKRVGSGLLLAVSDVAQEISDWGADVNEDSPVGQIKNMGWDGAFESKDCVP